MFNASHQGDTESHAQLVMIDSYFSDKGISEIREVA